MDVYTVNASQHTNISLIYAVDWTQQNRRE